MSISEEAAHTHLEGRSVIAPGYFGHVKPYADVSARWPPSEHSHVICHHSGLFLSIHADILTSCGHVILLGLGACCCSWYTVQRNTCMSIKTMEAQIHRSSAIDLQLRDKPNGGPETLPRGEELNDALKLLHT